MSRYSSESSCGFQEGWCDSPGTLEEVREKLHMRQRGTVKREKVTCYALSHQVGEYNDHNLL